MLPLKGKIPNSFDFTIKSPGKENRKSPQTIALIIMGL